MGSNRRDVLLAGAGAMLAPWTAAAQTEQPQQPRFKIVATGLQFPEGPIALADGTLLVCEIERRTLTRIMPDGRKEIVATVGGGPNGAALGPDGACYISNNGGLTYASYGPNPPQGPGSIQRVDLKTGQFTTLYGAVNGNPLVRPNDIVFDNSGGFWFTDAGRNNARTRDHAGIYWARADGSEIREVIYPAVSANGIALSPDFKTLYVAQSRINAYRITAPGEVEQERSWIQFGRKVEGSRPKLELLALPNADDGFDSMKVEADGRIVVGTLGAGGLTVISADGRERSHVPLPDVMTTNLAFGGPDMKTAFVCLSSRGELAAVDWPRPGLRLVYA